MNVNTGRQIVLAARPSSKPQLSDFRLEEVGVPTPRSGQVLLGVLYLSLDPYMRGRMDDRKSYAKPLQVGDVMVGEAVARVIESRHPEYSERDIVLAQTGWRTHAVADGAGVRKIDQAGPPVTTRLGARHAGVHGLFQPARGCSRDCGRSYSLSRGHRRSSGKRA